MITSRDQSLQSIKHKLQQAGHKLWSADDDTDNSLTTVDCYNVNGQQIALHQQFTKNKVGRKVEYQMVTWTLFLPLDVTGRIEDKSRDLDQILQEYSGSGQQGIFNRDRQPA